MFNSIIEAIAEYFELGIEDLQSRNCNSYEEIGNCVSATQEEIEVC